MILMARTTSNMALKNEHTVCALRYEITDVSYKRTASIVSNIRPTTKIIQERLYSTSLTRLTATIS